MTKQNAIDELKCYRAKSGTERPEEIELAIAALEQKESIGQVVKSVAQIVQQVSEDICNNYCKYRDTADDENLCDLIRNGGKCPLDLLN